MKAEELAKMIDHTNLKAIATEEDILRLCGEAKEYGFASVCVNAWYVPLAVKALTGTRVKVCTVVGFPLGATSSEAKVTEAVTAVLFGAEEIDMVINLGALKSGLKSQVRNDIQKVVAAVKEINHLVLVKVIIENCYLCQEEKVMACNLAVEAGADFVKTSTGFGSGGATCEDVKLMRQTVGEAVGVKGAGGIKTLSDAMHMISAGANRIGASAGVQIIKDLRAEKD